MKYILLFIALCSSHAFSVEFNASLGYQYHDADWQTANAAFDNRDFSDSGYHAGFVIRNNVGKNKRHYIGAGLDLHEIIGERTIGYRAIDYQYKINEAWRVGGFFGAASIDTGLPQNGYYMGVNGSFFFTNSISISLELKHGNGLARDRLLEDDPQRENEENQPDIFLDYFSSGIMLNWHF